MFYLYIHVTKSIKLTGKLLHVEVQYLVHERLAGLNCTNFVGFGNFTRVVPGFILFTRCTIQYWFISYMTSSQRLKITLSASVCHMISTGVATAK